MATCRTCTAPIRWAIDEEGNKIPLDEHEQLDYEPPKPVGLELPPSARYRIARDGTIPVVVPIPAESTARTFVDHRYLCMQPRVI